MNKIVLSMLLVAHISIVKAKFTRDDVTSSMHIKALLKASGENDKGGSILLEALKKFRSQDGAKIKMAVVVAFALRKTLSGNAAIRFREIIEKDEECADGDVVMADFTVKGDEDTVTVESDIHRIEVLYFPKHTNLQDVEKAVADAHETEGTYTDKDDCSECVYTWKNVFVHSENKIVYHNKAKCKSVFPKEQFVDELKKDNFLES